MEILSPTNWFISVLFPTLGLPIILTKPALWFSGMLFIVQFFIKITEDGFFILLIKNKIIFMCQPISAIKIDTVFRQLVAVRIMEMGKNKIVDRIRLQHLAGITDLRFILVVENEFLLLVRHSALKREKASYAKGDARM